jgi:hypothetical protein
MAGNGLVQIQVNLGDNWRTVSHVMNQGQHITHGMKNAERTYRNKRVRAVDPDGRTVDML